MGWCHEFGRVITAGCDHPMEAGHDACHCATCGTTCRGLFSGCPEVWQRGQPVEFVTTAAPHNDRARRSTQPPSESAGRRRRGGSPGAPGSPGSPGVSTLETFDIDWSAAESPAAAALTGSRRAQGEAAPETGSEKRRPTHHHTAGVRRRQKRARALAAGVAVMLVALVGVVLIQRGSKDDAVPVVHPFQSVPIGAYASVERIWRLTGSGGQFFEGELTFHNPVTTVQHVVFDELLPKTLVRSADKIQFLDIQAKVIQADPVFRYEMDLQPQSDVVARYRVEVARDGATKSRLDAWALQQASELEARNAAAAKAAADAAAAVAAAAAATSTTAPPAAPPTPTTARTVPRVTGTTSPPDTDPPPTDPPPTDPPPTTTPTTQPPPPTTTTPTTQPPPPTT